ncbi:MAG: glycosyltransferase family 4 protein [Casimicrobiaceae bacterium]
MNVVAASARDHRRALATAPRSIVLVGPLPPPSGGMANQTRQLAGLLSREGCAVKVVQVNAPYRPGWVAGVRGVRAFVRLLPYLWRLQRAIRDAELVHVMANSGWAWHLFAAPAIWIAWLRKVPTVVNYRGGDADAFFARQFPLVRPTLARAGVVAVPSGYLYAVFAKYGIATGVVPNIVNLDAFRPADVLPAQAQLLVTRNLEPIYDIATALRAFALVGARYPDARLTVAGSGPDRAALEELAAQLGIAERVRFTGRLDNAELPALYRAAGIVVNASRVDNMPISLLEAMASGVPIVSTNVGGIPHVVEHEATALLVPPGEPVAMANAIIRVLGDRQLALRLRAAGIEAVERYAWPKVRDEWFDAYARAIEAHR